MKSKLLPTLILTFFSLLSHSQNTAFIPDSGATWTISAIDWGNYYPQNPFAVIGDTLIETNFYYKINQSNDSVWNPNNSTYFCAVRQDQDKWIFIPQGDTAQYLLYDFGVNIGDTIQINNPWALGEVESEVMAIDSILLNGVYRTRISVNSLFGGFPEYWIEGIGSANGLFYTGYYLFDYGFQLMCFYENDTLIYLNAPNNDCRFTSLEIEETLTVNNVVIYPNPTSGEISFKITNHQSELSIYINEVNGKLIQKISNVQSGSKYNLSTVESGVYLLKITDSNGESVIKKLIIE